MQKHILVLVSTFFCFATLNAQVEKDDFEISQDEEQVIVSDHVTVYPSEVVGSRDVNCDCWLEPDETYTQFDNNNMDDGSTGNLALPFTFELFGTDYSSFWLNINGHITFDALPSGFFVDADFPLNRAMITPCHADVDLTCATCGDIFYKVTDDAVYINWVDVGHFNATSDQVQNFQLIFTSSTSTLLGDGNNVQFCYRDMQWTETNSSNTVEVGASSGNGTDYIQFGIFEDENNSDYDGPFDNNDGIDWLDNKTISFNSSLTSADNTPPISVGASECDTIRLCLDDTEALEFAFLAPENNQTVDVTIDDGGFTNLTSSIATGSYTVADLLLSSDGVAPGFYDLVVTATDTGTPAQSTTVSITVEVIAEAIPDLDIYFEEEIVTTVSYCEGQPQPTLSGTDGFECYTWTNGLHEQSGEFGQGTYSLEAFFMGCEANAGPVTVFQIPVFNPTVEITDQFICEGEETDIVLIDPDLYSDIEWDVFNNDGQIISINSEADTATVNPGFYELSVIDENGCPGTRIIPIIEEVVFIPNTQFAPLCDDTEISWNGAWAEPETCLYFINLSDSELDTWEGANLAVYLDGVLHCNLNIDNGAATLPTGVTPYHGQIIEYYFESGLDDDDIGIQLYNSDNNIVFDSTNGDEVVEGLFFTQVANCGFNALPGSWTVDAPAGGEGWTLTNEDVFNPVNGTNTFTAPEGVIGTYNVTFESSICASDITFPLIFSTAPTVQAFDYEGCSDDDVIITPEYGPDPFPGDVEYNWTPNLNDGFPTAPVSNTVNYSIEVSNSCGENEATGSVTITQSPSAVLSDQSTCDGASVTLDPGSNPDDSIVWDGPGVSGNTSATVSVTQGGTYTVDVTNDCGTASASAVVSAAFNPSIAVLPYDTLLCPGEPIEIDPQFMNADGPISWAMSWIDTLGVDQTQPFSETGPILTFGSDQIPLDAEDNLVVISYAYANSCGSAQGEILAIAGACFVIAPNVITPDNDSNTGGSYSSGLNEGWYIVGIENVSGVEVSIFDRWGNMVYESSNYNNSDPWRGENMNGDALEEGVYFYILKTPKGNKEINGTVTVLRN